MQDAFPSLPRLLADLPPPGARLCLQVRRFLASAGVRADRAETTSLTVAFSGGADSTALALLLRCLGFELTLAHLDHGLRPESAAEAERARRFGAALGVPCLCRRVDVAASAREKRMGLEEAGRVARYAFFEQVRRESGAALVALGHQADDLCEDVLLRLIRGTGWPALGGMRAVDRERCLVRPLLETPREAVTAFLRDVGVPWLEDPSNAEEHYRRNRLRHRVLPLIREENPAFARTVVDLWRLAREDEAYWEGVLAEVLCRVETTHDPEGGGGMVLRLPYAVLRQRPRAVRLRVYRALAARLGGEGCPISVRARTLFQLDAAWSAGRRHVRFQLPGGAEIVLEPHGLECRRVR